MALTEVELIKNGVIVDADISASAGINPSKINGSAIVDSDSRLTDERTPVDNSVTNAKVATNAAIAGTKISPDFGSQNITTTGTVTGASLNPTSNTVPTNGVYLPAANTVGISTNSAGRVFIDSSGRVGVNESAPATFDIRGAQLTITNATSDGIGVKGRMTDGFDRWYVGYNSSQHLEISQLRNNQLVFKTNNTEVARLTNEGKLGLGTSSVSNTLDIRATGANIGVRSTTSGQNQYIFFSNTADSTNGLILQTGSELRIQQQDNVSGSRITFYTKDSERVRIDDQGRVGVGATSPSGKLDVETASDTYVNFSTTNNGSAAGICLLGNNNNEFFGYANNLRFATVTGKNAAGFNERMRMDSSGRLGIGISSPTEALHVSGNILATGNITAYSDQSLKTDVNTIVNALDSVCRLRGVTYTRIGSEDQGVQIGLIAQEVEQVVPELVSTHSDGIKSLAYSNMVALLIEAVKQQQAQIAELKDLIAEKN